LKYSFPRHFLFLELEAKEEEEKEKQLQKEPTTDEKLSAVFEDIFSLFYALNICFLAGEKVDEIAESKHRNRKAEERN